jgi:hypothetical protein
VAAVTGANLHGINGGGILNCKSRYVHRMPKFSIRRKEIIIKDKQQRTPANQVK